MSIMKRSLLVLAFVSMSASVFSYHGHGGYYGGGGDFGGGLATGLVVGGLTGAAISSSNRRSDPDYRLNRDIERTEKALDKAERDIENARSERSESRARERAERLTKELNRLNRRYAQVSA